MGVNPDTNRIEPLIEADDETSERLAALNRELRDYHVDILRLDGSPVPKHWTILKQGELIDIKGYTFKIVYIGETSILLEPVSPVIVTQESPCDTPAG